MTRERYVPDADRAVRRVRSGHAIHRLFPTAPLQLLLRLAPALLVVVTVAVVLIGHGFWSHPDTADDITALPETLPLHLDDPLSTGGTTTDFTAALPPVASVTLTNVERVQIETSPTFAGYVGRPAMSVTKPAQAITTVPARRNETVADVAARMGTNATVLAHANGFTNPGQQLSAGQAVRVPPVGTVLHRITASDTLEEIARAYGVRVADITGYKGNTVGQTGDLVPGDFLIIPSTKVPVRERVLFYQVQFGDSLSRVASRYGLADPETLQWANSLPDQNLVLPGQVLAIPQTDGVIYVVTVDDTRGTTDDAVRQIAKKFACTAVPCEDAPTNERINALTAAIFAFGPNHLTHKGTLIRGQELMIPGGIPYVSPPPVVIPRGAPLDNGGAIRTSSLIPGGNAAITNTAARFLGQYYQASGLPWAFWCEKFVGDVADAAGVRHYRYGTAIADAYDGPLYTGRAPAGALVFFDQSWNYAGHVGIAMGDGTMISALTNGVVRTTYEGSYGYIGWRPFP